MLDKFQAIEKRYTELEQFLADPKVIANHSLYKQYAKEHGGLTEIVNKAREYRKLLDTINEDKQIIHYEDDSELVQLARTELETLEKELHRLEHELKLLLVPKDPHDLKNTFVEIRAGTGGEEAALFVADLFRMYSKYAEKKGWKIELINSNPTGIGGFKEIIFLVEGKGVYSHLKFESGVHRVQRVPVTEASGRIHTSAVTVAILPEAEEIELQIDPKDLRIDTFCSTGPGGQGVNTAYSAVRITHLPTGTVVTCQDERSQLKNKAKAMKVLRARLLDKLQREQNESIAENRRTQIGTGDRSERIRTYNFPQGRVTDHRIGLTLYKLDKILEGDLNAIIESLLLSQQVKDTK